MTYTLGVLPDDPSRERIVIDVMANPAGFGSQVGFCLDVVKVDLGTEMRCDGDSYLWV
jgi:hypothetical protein